VICASATNCKPSCASDSDCVYNYRCINTQCQLKKANGVACTLASECLSGICIVDVNGNGPDCHGCNSGETCPRDTPGCSDQKECINKCQNIRDPSGCNADGSYKCSVEFLIQATNPECDGQDHFHCGALQRCPGWMLCINGTCKVDGGQPCLNASDCASGSCAAGRCTLSGDHVPCTSDYDQECASGLICSGYELPSTQHVKACVAP
jgi:hypothetical protein